MLPVVPNLWVTTYTIPGVISIKSSPMFMLNHFPLAHVSMLEKANNYNARQTPYSSNIHGFRIQRSTFRWNPLMIKKKRFVICFFTHIIPKSSYHFANSISKHWLPSSPPLAAWVQPVPSHSFTARSRTCFKNGDSGPDWFMKRVLRFFMGIFPWICHGFFIGFLMVFARKSKIALFLI